MLLFKATTLDSTTQSTADPMEFAPTTVQIAGIKRRTQGYSYLFQQDGALC